MIPMKRVKQEYFEHEGIARGYVQRRYTEYEDGTITVELVDIHVQDQSYIGWYKAPDPTDYETEFDIYDDDNDELRDRLQEAKWKAREKGKIV